MTFAAGAEESSQVLCHLVLFQRHSKCFTVITIQPQLCTFNRCFKIWSLLLLRQGKANRSGDPCYWKDGLSSTVPRRRGCSVPGRAMWGIMGSIRRLEEQEADVDKSLYVVSSGRNGWGGKQAYDGLVWTHLAACGAGGLSLVFWPCSD